MLPGWGVVRRRACVAMGLKDTFSPICPVRYRSIKRPFFVCGRPRGTSGRCRWMQLLCLPDGCVLLPARRCVPKSNKANDLSGPSHAHPAILKILKLKQKRRLAEVASLEEPAKTSLKGEPDYAASPLLREQNRCSPSETHQRFGAKRQNQSPQQRTILALWMPLVAFRVSMTSCACSTIAP